MHFVLLLYLCITFKYTFQANSINRQQLVRRHNPHITSVDPWAPLSVGNGGFCFTVDVSGLQTLSEHYFHNGIPLETQSRWSWHQSQNTNHYKLSDAYTNFTSYGKTIGYPTQDKTPAGMYLRENPHAMPLPRIALDFDSGNNVTLLPNDFTNINQTLDLWTGIITSNYSLKGENVFVVTACNPKNDEIVVRIESSLILNKTLGIKIAVPRGHDIKVKNLPELDWSQSESHETRIISKTSNSLIIEHIRDESHYTMRLTSKQSINITNTKPHYFIINAIQGNVLEFTLEFGRDNQSLSNQNVSADDIRNLSAENWQKFWQSGGAIDLSGSKDSRDRT